MDKATFEREVLIKSQQQPVLVDFWAPWCGPCRVLGPVVEELAAEAQDKWKLIKVNVDESQEIASHYGVMSIPTVILFHQGKLVDQFAGALPKIQIQQWLNDRLPDVRKDELNAIYARLQGGINEKAIQELEDFVQQNSDIPEAKVWLAGQIVTEDVDRAEELIGEIRIGHKLYEDAEDIRNLIAWMKCEDNDNTKLHEKVAQAREAYKARKMDDALSLLIESIMIDKSYCKEIARRASIAIFHQLGEAHEITRKFRPRFNMALY